MGGVATSTGPSALSRGLLWGACMMQVLNKSASCSSCYDSSLPPGATGCVSRHISQWWQFWVPPRWEFASQL